MFQPVKNHLTENLLPPQAEVVAHGFLDSGFNCVLQMPTGSGKTWLAEQAIERTLQQNLRAVYLSPLRALASELATRWQQKFSKYKIGIFTGDYSTTGKTYPVSFRDAQLLVMTPEKLDACTRFWRSHWSWIPEVDLIVVDELHLLGNAHRGARLEGALSRIRRLNPFARILGLSATLGNRSELSDWLNGVDYVSNWRPVKLEWRFIQFQKATEKPNLLLAEVFRNIKSEGKSLVFVQSRRRAEETSSFLRSQGIRSYHHHAGLGHEERHGIQRQFLANEIDVLVATSTLEMGLNLPVRQVILYDLQTFNGAEFKPLPTNSVWQRVGRAGRQGFGEVAEAVLITPAWDRSSDNYERGDFEPIISALSHTRALSEQIIAEVSSGMSKTEDQLTFTFGQSLAAKQKILPDVKRVIKQMLASGMLALNEDEEAEKNNFILKATRLGRVASRHFLEPETVLLFRRALAAEQLTFFDLLLICACSMDCDPILLCDYEELGDLWINLNQEYSFLLKTPKEKMISVLGVDGKRLLASLKMSLAMREWCRLGEVEKAAEKYNCYPFEILRLKESFVRLLTAMSAIVRKPIELKDTDEFEFSASYDEKVRTLLVMVEGGLDEYGATLSMINGVGPKLAKRLKDAGVNDLLELSKTDANLLKNLKGIKIERLRNWIKEAKNLARTYSAYELFDIASHNNKHSPKNQLTKIDPYRLRRAIELKVNGTDGGNHLVTGGTEPHIVQIVGGKLICDCVDFRHRNDSICKHIIAVRLYRGDTSLQQAVKKLNEVSNKKPIDVFELWFAGQKSLAAK